MEFKKKDLVLVTKDGSNASDFSFLVGSPMGVYSVDGWENTVFEIEGSIQLISFEHNEAIKCAYLLTHKGVEIGYVYNNALCLASDVLRKRNEPAISKERLNEFKKPLNDYFERTVQNGIDTIAQTLINSKVENVKPFRTVGVITESDTFFNKKIAASSGAQLTKFVKISKEQHFNGHDFDFIFLDSYFDKRHDLLHFYASKNWK